MRTIRHLVVLSACLAVAATALAGPAFAASPLKILRDCSDDGRLQGTYTDADLQRALSDIRGDTAAYTNCAGAITAAIGSNGPGAKSARNDDGNGGRGGSGSGGGNGGFGSGAVDANGDVRISPSERRAAAQERAEERSEHRQIASIADDIVGPADGDEDGGPQGAIVTGDASAGIPTPVIIALIALVLALATGGTWYAAHRYPAIGNALRRVQLPNRRG